MAAIFMLLESGLSLLNVPPRRVSNAIEPDILESFGERNQVSSILSASREKD